MSRFFFTINVTLLESMNAVCMYKLDVTPIMKSISKNVERYKSLILLEWSPEYTKINLYEYYTKTSTGYCLSKYHDN